MGLEMGMVVEMVVDIGAELENWVGVGVRKEEREKKQEGEEEDMMVLRRIVRVDGGGSFRRELWVVLKWLLV